MTLFKNAILFLSLLLMLVIWFVFSTLIAIFFGFSSFAQLYAFMYGIGIGLLLLIYPRLKNKIYSLFN
jgi:hypothetical protein